MTLIETFFFIFTITFYDFRLIDLIVFKILIWPQLEYYGTRKPAGPRFGSGFFLRIVVFWTRPVRWRIVLRLTRLTNLERHPYVCASAVAYKTQLFTSRFSA